jgi:hypothetical protein
MTETEGLTIGVKTILRLLVNKGLLSENEINTALGLAAEQAGGPEKEVGAIIALMLE